MRLLRAAGGARVGRRRRERIGRRHTEADDGATGWVNALYGRGGSNDGEFAKAPNCNGAHGTPPAGSVVEPPSSSSPSGGKCSSTPGSGDSVTRWTPVVTCVLSLLGQNTSANVSDILIVITHESGEDPNAINRTDSNAAAGHPSQGLMQTIPSTFEEWRDPNLSSNILDPAANIYAGANYAIHRYGSIAKIPGVDAVNHGGSYVGYALPTGIQPLTCASVNAGRLSLAILCSKARTTVSRLARSRSVRHALAHARGYTTVALKQRVGKRTYECELMHYKPGTLTGASVYRLTCAHGETRLDVAAATRGKHRHGQKKTRR